jgi:hypothetical protein
LIAYRHSDTVGQFNPQRTIDGNSYSSLFKNFLNEQFRAKNWGSLLTKDGKGSDFKVTSGQLLSDSVGNAAIRANDDRGRQTQNIQGNFLGKEAGKHVGAQ